MILRTLVEFLDRNQIRYVNVTHSTAFTAQDVAESAHIPRKEMAKTVIVWMGGALAMVVLPSSSRIDFNKLKEITGATSVEPASESEFKDRFPQYEVGAMPPFGNLFDARVYADAALREDREISFNAGSHHELIRLLYSDFERLVRPTIGSFAVSN